MTPEQFAEQEYAHQLARRGYTPTAISKEIRALYAGKTPPRIPTAPEAIVQTASGRKVSLTSPRPGMFAIEDIAYGLSGVCRFSGQTAFHYSVAEHSIMVAQLTPPRIQLHALLHDASEAYMQDIPAPLKALLPVYRAMEHHVMQTILSAFDVHNEPGDVEIVKEADRLACAVEVRDLFLNGFDPGNLPEPPEGVRIREPRAREDVISAFLAFFHAARGNGGDLRL